MVSRVRVWLNRTYAENVFFMDQLRRNPSDRAVEIHATHGDPDSPVLAAASNSARCATIADWCSRGTNTSMPRRPRPWPSSTTR